MLFDGHDAPQSRQDALGYFQGTLGSRKRQRKRGGATGLYGCGLKYFAGRTIGPRRTDRAVIR
jgi:hypothetical protein